jgi:endonuclease YncB( thermonuclease family)
MPRRRLILLLLGIAIVLAAGGYAVAKLGRPSATDRYIVIDGDTLEVVPHRCWLSHLGIGCRAQRLRLYGVDAFESKQTCHTDKGVVWQCGAVATERLKELVAHPDFSCTVDTEFVDRHAREFCLCSIGSQDVGATLVSDGLAFAYGRGAQYLPLEARAKAEKRGAWSGTFVRPQYFRQGSRE